jgi:hypothetical protein
LIAFAAAGVKAREGRVQGVAKHGGRARTIFGKLREESAAAVEQMGLSVDTLLAYAESVLQAPSELVNSADDPVVRVMPFELMVGW